MIARQLRALVWKDLRINRPIVAFYFCVILGSIVLLMIAGQFRPPRQGWTLQIVWDVLCVASTMLMGFTVLVAAVLAANTVAGEYTDRSAAFLAYLPPSTRMVLVSKVVAALGMTLLLGGFSLAWFALGMAHRSEHLGDVMNLTDSTRLFLTILWAVFASSWAAAVFTHSVPLGVVIGVVLPLLLGMAAGLAVEHHSISVRKDLFVLVVELVVGTGLFVVSCISMLRRRVAPA